MMWFVAGTGAGVYVMVKARRAVETFTPEGLADRLSGLSVGAHLFAQEVREGREQKETELRDRLGLALDGPAMLTARERAVVSTGSTDGGAVVSTGSTDGSGSTDQTGER